MEGTEHDMINSSLVCNIFASFITTMISLDTFRLNQLIAIS
jgi:hypothetical protein